MKSLVTVFFMNIFLATAVLSQEAEYGLASYYADQFQGKPTASGELYDRNKLTVAHKTLPFGTLVKVTRLDNNKSIQARVNDRGPFISGRVVEVSGSGAEQLDLIKAGSARVKVEVIVEKPAETVVIATPEPVKPQTETTPDPPAPETVKKPEVREEQPPKAVKKKEEDAPKTTSANTTPAKKTNVSPKKGEPVTLSQPVLVKAADYQTYDLFQIELKRPDKKGYGVQVASLTTQDALFKKLAELQGDWFSTILVSVQQSSKKDMVYKVILGTFATEEEADIYKTNLRKNKKMNGFVVDLSTLNNNE